MKKFFRFSMGRQTFRRNYFKHFLILRRRGLFSKDGFIFALRYFITLLGRMKFENALTCLSTELCPTYFRFIRGREVTRTIFEIFDQKFLENGRKRLKYTKVCQKNYWHEKGKCQKCKNPRTC